MSAKYFTVPEANAAVRAIRPLMEEIHSIRQAVLARRPDLWQALARAAGNGGGNELSQLAVEFRRLDELVHAILETGAQIKDLGEGLVDFPAWRQEHVVYLCWKFGEDDVGFWHEADAGFAGRQTIDTF